MNCPKSRYKLQIYLKNLEKIENAINYLDKKKQGFNFNSQLFRNV